MSFEIVTIPCLQDNYAYLLVKNGGAVLVDVPDAAPILEEVRKRGLLVHTIWLTHHHDDHIQGVDAFLDGHEDGYDVTLVGSKKDKHRLPECEHYFEDGDSYEFVGDHKAYILDVSGHTLGHIAFYVPDAKAAFTGDSLMALGCGRVFEGTFDQMWDSLSKLAALPPETTICSGHEYTEANGRFALTIEPNNPALLQRIEQVKAARADGIPTVPSQLSEELATNPFLRAGLAEVKMLLNMPDASDAAVFAEIRRRKDSF